MEVLCSTCIWVHILLLCIELLAVLTARPKGGCFLREVVASVSQLQHHHPPRLPSPHLCPHLYRLVSSELLSADNQFISAGVQSELHFTRQVLQKNKYTCIRVMVIFIPNLLWRSILQASEFQHHQQRSLKDDKCCTYIISQSPQLC